MKKMLRQTVCTSFMLSALILAAGIVGVNAQFHENNRDRDLSVMTRNLYPGTDFDQIFNAQTPEELVTEVAEAYTNVQQSLPAERIAGVADEIQAASPDLVGVQEAALWRIGAPFDPAPATNVTYDFLELLLDELAERGLHYEAIAVKTNFDAEVPAVFSQTLAFDVRYTDRLVVLARTDLKTSELKIENIEAHHFTTSLTFSSPTLGTITIPRAWIAVDAKLRGKTYRFVTAHPESFVPIINFIQVSELVQTAGATDSTLIIAGDLNTDAAANDAAYQVLINSGLTDVWTATHPNEAGLTWALFIGNPAVYINPTQRLDLILTRGEISAVGADLTGENPATDRTPSGLMRSDHAGVTADFVLLP